MQGVQLTDILYFPELLLSNEQPNDQQWTAVSQAIKLVKDEFSAQAVIRSTIQRRQIDLAYFLQTHEAILSPIRRIPAEIIEQIFLFVINDSRPTLSDNQLGRVCRLWSDVASSLPQSLAILPPIRHTSEIMLTERIPALEMRIAGIPSSVLFSVHILDWKLHPANLYIAGHSNRWGSLFITVDHNALDSFRRTLSNKTPNLRSLKLYVPADGSKNSLRLSPALGIYPVLRELEVESQAPLTLKVPWSQLTYYKERSHTVIGLNNLLQDGSVVEHVEYRTSNPFSIPVAAASATLNCLKYLDLRLYCNTSHKLLGRLTAPILEKIRIRDLRQNFPGELRSFITRSSCGASLTRLSFHTAPMQPGELTKVLFLTPVLTELECSDIPFPDLCMIDLIPGKPTLVPYLQLLTIHSSTTISGVKKLAINRSHRVDPRSRKRPLRSLVPQDPFSVRLVFRGREMCNSAAKELEMSQSCDPEIVSKLSNVLWELDILVDECRTRKNGRLFFGILQSISDRNIGHSLDEILTFLETISPVDVPEFHIWVLYVLHKFWALNRELIPYERKHDLLKRSSGLVYTWKFFFRDQYIYQGFIRHGPFCLLYYHSTEEIKQREWTLLHGRYRIIDDTEVFWPFRDFSENEPIQDYIKWRRSAGMN